MTHVTLPTTAAPTRRTTNVPTTKEMREVPVDAVITLGVTALRFGRVDRITYHEDGLTRESDTDHTVMLGLVACALAAATEPDLDLGLIAQYALVHDLVEVYAGDTPTLRVLNGSTQAAAKAQREHAAYQRLADEFGDALPWLVRWIGEYEQRQVPEARYVKALDKLLPKITHLANRGVTLREQGMGYDELCNRYAVQERELAEYAADFPSLFTLRADLVKRVLAACYRQRDAR